MPGSPTIPASFRRQFGELLRRERIERKIQSKTLAARISVSPQMITEYEKGIALPSAYTLLQIMNLLKLKPSTLLRCAESDGKDELRGIVRKPTD